MAKTDFLREAKVGEVRAVYNEEGRIWGVVRTPTGQRLLKVGAEPEEGTAYTSLSEPRKLVEKEILTWGFGHLLEEAQVEPRLEGWSPPGLLFEVYMAPEYLVAYWKNGHQDFLEVWRGPSTHYLLEREREPQAWWRLYQEMRRLRKRRLGLVVMVEPPPTRGGSRGYYFIA